MYNEVPILLWNLINPLGFLRTKVITWKRKRMGKIKLNLKSKFIRIIKKSLDFFQILPSPPSPSPSNKIKNILPIHPSSPPTLSSSLISLLKQYHRHSTFSTPPKQISINLFIPSRATTKKNKHKI